jgi:hypothetical protein
MLKLFEQSIFIFVESGTSKKWGHMKENGRDPNEVQIYGYTILKTYMHNHFCFRHILIMYPYLCTHNIKWEKLLF